MTSKERVRRAVNHEATDRVPVDYYVRDDVSLTFQNYLGLPDLESVYKKLGIDIRKFTVGETVPAFLERSGGKPLIYYPDGSYENVWGVRQKPSEDGRYYEMVGGPFFETEDLDSFPWPSMDSIDSIETIKNKIAPFKDEYSIWGSLNNPFKCCWHMRGLENYLMDTIADEDFAMALWDKTAEYETEKGIRLIKAGADALMVTGDIAMQDRMLVSLPAWRKNEKPRLAKMLSTWKELKPDLMLYFHTDGDMEEVLLDLVEAGFNIINPVQPECMDVEYIKKKYGKICTLHGTISLQKTLPFGTVEDVRNETLHRVSLGKEDGGIIIAPSNHVQADTPMENLLEIYRAAGSCS